MSTPHRGPAAALIALVLVAGWLVDSQVARPKAKATTYVATPTGAPASARSAAWFCAGATATADNSGAANGTVVIANAGRRALNGTVTVVPSEGDSRAVNVTVASNGRATVKLSDVAPAPFASALVELDGGEAVVDLAGSGSLGDTVTPCASNAATSWYFAEGITTKDATEVITLFNPFPEDAVVDMVFTTEEGEVTPQALTGLSVKGRGMAAVSVNDNVQRRESVSASITARAGRLVAARLQSFDGSVSRKGVSLSLGAAAPGTAWYFPEGFLTDGITERYQLYNPGDKEAATRVDLSLEQGSAEPITLTVPPQSRVTLSANDEARIPKNVAHAVTVRSTNGVGVVVERTIDAASPAPRSGLAITLGARLPSDRAVVAAGQADDSTDEYVVVQNPGNAAAMFTVTLLDDGAPIVAPRLDRVSVPAHQRVAVKLNDSVRKGATSVLVTATGPVVVERDAYKTKAAGMLMSPGTPLRS